MARRRRARGREALPGGLTFRDLNERLRSDLQEKFATGENQYLYVRDLTDEWVIYELEGSGVSNPGCFRVDYAIADDGAVTLSDPVEVAQRTVYEVKEAEDRLRGRLLEAKGTDDAGGHVYAIELIRYGASKNKRRYPESVMRSAARLYEGARAFDHHRTEGEFETSTIAGLVGYYTNVKAGSAALSADLHVLPSAEHVVEAFDASLAAQEKSLEPIVGISHDVMARYRPLIEGGERLLEATEIVSVNSVDIVAHPAAGGRVTRMVAGGNGDEDKEEQMTLEQLLELINGASAEDRQAIADALGVAVPAPAGDSAGGGGGGGAGEGGEGGEGKPKSELVGAAAESSYAKNSPLGQLLVRTTVTGAGLDERLVEAIAKHLPEKFTEADLTRTVETAKNFTEQFEKAGLAPKIPATAVTTEERDKKVKALDEMIAGNYREGYRSFKEAFIDITGFDTRRIFAVDGEDFHRVILRESLGNPLRPFDSAIRSKESIETSSWAEILGDSLTRRMVAEYGLQQLATWRRIVSSIVPVNDFRSQRIDRMGGYGTLPAVGQGAVYQPLTSPTDEEVTYSISKRGGTEDLTLEAIANDDLRAVQRIPQKLGRAAAQTLYRFVFDFLKDNPVLYDNVALFASGHTNTDAAAALSASTLSTGRRKMREQTAYGNTSEVLGAIPRFLIVPPELEETGFKLSRSAVAVVSGENATTPNIHEGLELLVIDYYSDADDWFVLGDPALIPTIEIGFYQGREDPELFVQDDPRVGAVFNADKLTWKIRHIYSGAVLDFRGFYRGQG